jgi:hypothetical protein
MLRYEKPEPGTPIVLDLDGRKLELRYTFRTLKALKVEHDINVIKPEQLMAMVNDPEKLAIVLWYGLKTKEPEITLDWIDDHFDAPMLMELWPAMAYAISGRLPDIAAATAASPNVERPADPPTGSPSGPLADTTSTRPN